MKTNNFLDFHADDYALSPTSDDNILTLCKNGFLNSISIIPNLNIFTEAVKKYKEACELFPNAIKVSIHLNVMEGHCLAEKSKLPHLVNENGFFKISWGQLFLWSYNPLLRKTIKKELSEEITAQIQAAIKAQIVDANSLRIDSHQHPHMIPIFFDALLDSIDSNAFQVEYIRNTEDHIRWYLPFVSLYRTFSIANIVKCLILNFYSFSVKHALKKRNIMQNYLMGVFFSGKMNGRVQTVLPHIIKKTEKSGKFLEILFHPGCMKKEELSEEFTKPGFNEFHIDNERNIEFKSIQEIQN